MKFDKKDSKSFNKTKKFVYVSAITGVLLTGAQASQFASTYTANADSVTAESNKVTISFVDQFGKGIQTISGENILPAIYNYGVQDNTIISKQSLVQQLQQEFSGISVDHNNILDPIDDSKAGNYTFQLTLPSHSITINLVDQNNNIVRTETVSEVTDYTTTDVSDLIQWAADHNYDINSSSLIQNNQSTVNIPVTAHSTNAVNPNNQSQQSTNTQPTQTATVSDSKSASETSQPATSTDAKTETTTTTTTAESSKPAEQTSPVSQTTKTDATTTTTQSPAKTTTPSPSVTEAVSKPVDPVNKGEAKKTVAKQAPATKNKDVRAKLPQTGDNTNQTRAIALGVATIALGLGLAYFGLRRKNK
ncbi:LPXTG cell wall anchor domain-containing protein [Apilactobacillus nanyangensis]|uniref:LPXTG cell wall anchor domain-containing protein n=1 Tax=Apilactobacillus nanyangensis TaxID=2799579 RepID=UPI0019453010|nr:LPXTG cell wall anchor domain-containing protein [Apilactobacillus nanyangensis]